MNTSMLQVNFHATPRGTVRRRCLGIAWSCAAVLIMTCWGEAAWAQAAATQPGEQQGMQAIEIDYADGDTALRGVLYLPAGVTADQTAGRPGVMVVHEWWGLNDYAKRRAAMIADLGYVAFAADMYGVGEDGQARTTDDPKQAGKWAGAISGDRAAYRERAAAGLRVLAGRPEVDASRLAAMGYCFGGTTVMELAYSGAALRGVASFHGSPKPPAEGEAADVLAAMVLYHGVRDSLVPTEQLVAAMTPLEKAGKTWELVAYSGAKHAFTNPAADSYGMAPVGYDARADRRSWQHLQEFLSETLEAPAATQPAANTAALRLEIDREGRVRGPITGQDMTGLDRFLANFEDPQMPIILQADSMTPFRKVVAVLDVLERKGYRNVTMTATQR